MRPEVTRACAAALGALGLACAPEVVPLLVPSVDPRAGVIVAFERLLASGPEIEVWAVDPSNAAASGLPLRAGVEDASVRVTAIVLDGPLASERIAPGRMTVAPPGPGTRALPAGQVFECLVDRGEPCVWALVPAPSQALLELRVATGAPSPCAELDSRLVPLEGPGGIEIGVRLDRDRALIATKVITPNGRENRFFLVHKSGSVEEATISGGAPFFSGAQQLSDGRLLLTGPRHEVWIAELEAGPVLRARRFAGTGTTATSLPVHWIEASADGSEIFTLTFDGVLERWDGARWSGLYNFRHVFGTGYRGGLARLGPGSAIAVKPTEPVIVEIRDGVPDVMTLDPGSAPSSAAVFPELGAIVGTSQGELLERDGGWGSLGVSGLDLMVLSFAAYRDGFLFAGYSGWVGQYRRSSGFCQVRQLGSADSYLLIPLDGGAFVLSGTGEDTANALAVVLLQDRAY